MCDELKMLWEHGIMVKGIKWRVAIVNGIWDGKGYESVTKTMGSNSLHGCQACDFPGIHFGGTIKYPFYSRYSPPNDTRRQRRPTHVTNSRKMWNLGNDANVAPRKRGYLQFIRQAEEVVEGIVTNSEVGINGVWIPHCLPYAHLLYRTKDIMHSAFNVVKDSIRVMKPHVAKPLFNNRTQSTSVVQSCREYSVFPFVYAEEPSWPWIFTNPEIQQHDNRFKLVLGIISQVIYTQFTLHLPFIYTNLKIHLPSFCRRLRYRNTEKSYSKRKEREFT